MYDDRYGYRGQYDLLKCANCDHIFLDAEFSNDELVDLYTNYYPRSDLKLESYKPLETVGGFKGWFNGEKRSFAFVPPAVRVLDIGCGFGESLGYHKSRGCDVYGCEADENIKKVAEKFNFNVHVGVFDHKNYQPDFFDYVTMDQVLEHAKDPTAMLAGIYRILKPDGKLVITIPNANGWGATRYKEKWLHWHTPYHLHFFSSKSLKLSAQKVGLKLDKITTITSSEWLFYQKIHNICFPKHGERSFFFSPKMDWQKTTSEQKQLRDKIQKEHQKKINHITTRVFDFVNQGDNLLVVLAKP